MIEEKNHEYVKVYRKQLRKPIERNTLQLVNTPAKTETSDDPYLGKFAHLFFTRGVHSPSDTKMADNSSPGPTSFPGYLVYKPPSKASEETYIDLLNRTQ